MARKNDRNNAIIVIAVLLIAAVYMGFIEIPDFETVTIGGDSTSDDYVASSDGVPAESLKIHAKDKYTDTAIGSAMDVELYSLGADVGNPNVAELTKGDFSSGVVTDTSYLFLDIDSSNTKDLWMEGGSTYYNEKVPIWDVKYNKDTGKGVMYFGNNNIYYKARPIGTFSDLDTAAGSTSATCVRDSGTDTNEINYSVCTTTFYVEYEIGNSAANSELQDVVICFQDSGTATDALEGDEITAIDVGFISGDRIDSTGILSGDLISLWQSAAGSGNRVCKTVNPMIGETEQGKYRFTFTYSNSSWVDTDENFRIDFDDLGGYGAGEYPDFNAKATASGVQFSKVIA